MSVRRGWSTLLRTHVHHHSQGARDGERGLPDDAQGLLRVGRRARARDRDAEEAGVRPHAAPAGEPAQPDPGAREEGPARSRCEEL